MRSLFDRIGAYMMSRWGIRNGYRDVLVVGLPLVASMASATITQFTDRVFLGHYSLEALAASMAAGSTQFLFYAFFSGLASYVNVFIAQYTGAGRHRDVGPALWQGLWFTLFSTFCMALLAIPGDFIFSMAGHAPAVRELEVQYYRILCCATGFNIAMVTLGGFYTGRGITRPVMLVDIAGALLNIPLDYVLINGIGPFPELGIRGAGYATAISWAFSAVLFVIIIFTRENEEKFNIRSGWRLNSDRFKKLLHFGLPNGLEFFLDVFGFTVFILLVGRLGNVELAATNMVLTLNQFSFLPMVGFHIAAETLVGQAIGAKRPDEGEVAATSTVHMCLVWAGIMVFVFLVFPGVLTDMFRPADFTAAEYEPMKEMGQVLLWFVAFYTLFDAVAITYLGALKGAGDTRYVMKIIGTLSIFVMVLPIYLVLEVFHLGLYAGWMGVVAYVLALAFFAVRRFRQGHWKTMSVIG